MSTAMTGALESLVGPRRRAYSSLARNRNFRRWFWSSLGSSFGDWIGLFALQVLVISLAEPGSRLALFGLGAIMLARVAPSALLGPIAGVVSDRLDRKRVMIACDFARAGLFVAVAYSRTLWLLLALVFVVETFSLAYFSAKSASLPNIVATDHLPEANQITLLVSYGPMPFGAAAGALLAWLAGFLRSLDVTTVEPITAALLVNAATFVVAGLLLWRLEIRGPGPDREGGGDESAPARPSAMSDLREGLRFIWQSQRIRGLVVGVVSVFFGLGVVVAIGPEFVRSELGRANEDWFGLMATVGAGLLLGIAAAPILSHRLDRLRLFAVTVLLAIVGAVGAGLVTAFWFLELLGFAFAGFAGVGFVTGYTLLQELSEGRMRGRVFSVFFTGTRITLFAALGLAPFAAAFIGSPSVGDVELSGLRIVMVAGSALALAGVAVGNYGMLRGD